MLDFALAAFPLQRAYFPSHGISLVRMSTQFVLYRAMVAYVVSVAQYQGTKRRFTRPGLLTKLGFQTSPASITIPSSGSTTSLT